MIADVYESEKAAKLIGVMNSLITVFMSIAPIAGGFINNLVGFRGNYFVIALVSLISWVMLYFQLPETKKEKKTLKESINENKNTKSHVVSRICKFVSSKGKENSPFCRLENHLSSIEDSYIIDSIDNSIED